MPVTNANYRTAPDLLRDRISFTNSGGTFSATRHTMSTGADVYDIYSYSTRIATVEDGILWFSPSRYSKTTTRQQNLVLRTLGHLLPERQLSPEALDVYRTLVEDGVRPGRAMDIAKGVVLAA